MKGDKNMDYKTMRNQIEDMVNDNHKDFVKAIISMVKGRFPSLIVHIPVLLQFVFLLFYFLPDRLLSVLR